MASLEIPQCVINLRINKNQLARDYWRDTLSRSDVTKAQRMIISEGIATLLEDDTVTAGAMRMALNRSIATKVSMWERWLRE